MSSRPRLHRIGLTGGIGSGKSTVAEVWRGTGAVVIDLDAHSRRVLDEPGDGVEETVTRFGEEFRTARGTIDRVALGRLVFADDDARSALERIVLGRVDVAVARAEQEAARAGKSLVVHDNPLLLEKHREDDYDRVVAVLAAREERIRRIVTDRGRDRDYALGVMAAQVTDRERALRADHLLWNNGGRDELAERSHRLLRQLHEELVPPR